MFGKEVGLPEGFWIVESPRISTLVLLANKVERVAVATPLSVGNPDAVGRLELVVKEGWMADDRGKDVGGLKGFVVVGGPGGYDPVRMTVELEGESEVADEGERELPDDGEKEVADDGEREVAADAEVAGVADDAEGKKLDELDELAGLDRLHKLSASLAASGEDRLTNSNRQRVVVGCIGSR